MSHCVSAYILRFDWAQATALGFDLLLTSHWWYPAPSTKWYPAPSNTQQHPAPISTNQHSALSLIGLGPASNILILHEARPGMRPQTVHFEKHRSMSTQQIICCVVYFKGVLEVKQINCCVPGGVLYRPNGFAASLGRILQFTLSLFQKTMMCGS